MIESLSNFVTSSVSQWGYLAIFILMALSSMCMPVSSEIVLMFAGYMAFQGKLNILYIIIIGSLGNLTGSVISYYIGLYGGRPLFLKYGRYFFIKEKELKWAENWFDRFGDATVFFGRMVPVIRALISVPAGIAQMNSVKFYIYTSLGVLPWDIGLVYAGYLLGANWHKLTKYMNVLSLIVIVVLVIMIIAFIFYKRRIKPANNKLNKDIV